jgi:hypothetical protein
MEKNFIIETIGTLIDQKRVKEAVDFCERVIEEVPLPELKCLALLNLSEIHFFLTGDAVAARKANEDGLAILDENNMDLVFNSKRVSAPKMKRVYSDLCEQIRAIAISIDEYDKYAHKPKAVRPLNPTEIKGLDGIKKMREKGIPWKEDMFNRADDYFNHAAYGQAASIYQLLIENENRRNLRLDRTDLNFAIQQYSNAFCGLLDNHLGYCEANHQKPDAYNYTFILEKAISVVESCKDDRLADAATIERHLEILNKIMSDIENRCNYSGGHSPQPTKGQIDRELPSQMEALCNLQINKGISQKPKTGCFVVQFLIGLAGASWFWYSIIGKSDTAWYNIVGAIFLSFYTLGSLSGAIRNRKK